MALNSPLRSALGSMTRSKLGVLETSGANPWNFAIDDLSVANGQVYSNVGAMTPLTVIPNFVPGGVLHFPNSNNQLYGVVNLKLLMTEGGWYDFAATTIPTSNGSYTESAGLTPVVVFSTVTISGTIYVLYSNGSGGFFLGTTVNGKLITRIGAVPLPALGSGTVFTNAVGKLTWDGTNLAFACQITRPGILTRVYWFITTNFGASWSFSSQVLSSTSFSGGWIDGLGNQYLYYSANQLRKSNDYFTSSVVLPTTNLTNTGSTFQNVIPMADGIRVYLANDSSQARVIHVDNSTADIVLMGAGNGYFPCIDSDRTTIYAYNSGIVSSLDFTTWTQLTTELTILGKQPTFKASQCVN